MSRLAKHPFARFLHRSMLALAVLGLWPFLRSIGVHSWQALGLARPAGQWKNGAYGFAVGFCSLACVAVLALATGTRRLDLDFSSADFLTALTNAVLAALVVGLVEEALFRGGLFGALRKQHHWVVALLMSSVVYALVHFLPKTTSPPEITWSSGLELLPPMLSGVAGVEGFVPSVFTLTVAGLILGLAYHQTGTLYLSIGLHAGWIFWLKFYGFLTANQVRGQSGFWGSARMVDGWLALLVLLIVLLFFWFVPRRKMTASYAG